jgi:hypothetical protein
MSSSAPPPARTCVDDSSAAAEPLAGTATRAEDWLVVERRGAWGRDAVLDTDLPPAVRDALAGFPGRVLLVRRPGRRGTETIVFRGRSEPAGGSLTRLTLPDLESVADANATAGEPVTSPLLLVCAHGRRDPCCARLGPPLYDALAPHVDPASLWQSSHQGGHRFAANVLVLPAGIQLGRVAPADAGRVVALVAAGRIPLDHYRGRTLYAAPTQAAEVEVRRRLGLDRIGDVALLEEHGDTVLFDTPAGVVTATVTETAGPPVLPSCGAERESGVRYDVEVTPGGPPW